MKSKGPARSRTTKLAFGILAGIVQCLALAAQFLWPAQANDFRRGPLIDLSDPDALAGWCMDSFGNTSNGRETEPFVAVNPTNPKNIVSVWFGGSPWQWLPPSAWMAGRNGVR
jgi:hypothetical protein